MFYEIFLRSFYDSNGDGIGDIRGLIQKLDYLNDGDSTTTTDLGISGIWLMPINPSPSYHGFDVTDYRNVNPQYGTLSDFRMLIDSAHARGIKVIIDFVMNHSSSQHPWFVQSATSSASPYRDWYIWSSIDPGYRGPWGEQVWFPRNGAYYFGIFTSGMPDLNMANSQVKAAMFDATRFWLDSMKADGFRLDAVKHLFENGQTMENVPATFTFLKEFRQLYKGVNPDAMMVGEVWSETSQIARYCDGTTLDFCFEFALATAIIDGVRTNQPARITLQMQTILQSYTGSQYAPFLSNHDQDRVFSQFQGDPGKMKLAAAVYLTLPGIPFLYYGEEIGMTGSGADPNKRTPMQWTAGPGAGFTTGTPWRSVNTNYPTLNVEVMQTDTSSLWAWYRRLIAVRRAHTSLQTGDYVSVETSVYNLYAYARRAPHQVTLVLHNFTGSVQRNPPISLAGSPLPAGLYAVKELLTGQEAGTVVLNASGGFTTWGPVITIQPQGTALLEIDNSSWLPSFALSGTVKGHKEEGISGVQLVINGIEEMTSGSDGGYSFPNVRTGAQTITPWKSGFTFIPVARTVYVMNNIADVNFAGIRGSHPVTVTFDVSVPDNTPTNSAVYIAGTFNAWDPGVDTSGTDTEEHDIALPRWNGHRYRLTVSFEAETRIEYKYTRGGWSSAEKGPMGEEMANRTLVVPDADTILTDAVKTWTDMAVTSVAGNIPSIPERALLYQNYPNPFNSSTSIRFVLPSRSHVNLRIYDLLGRQVATVAEGELQEGLHARHWHAAGASGVYILRLEAQNLERPHEVYRESRTMTLMR